MEPGWEEKTGLANGEMVKFLHRGSLPVRNSSNSAGDTGPRAVLQRGRSVARAAERLKHPNPFSSLEKLNHKVQVGYISFPWGQ